MVGVPPTHAPRWPPGNSAVLLSAEFSPWSAPLRKLELIGRRADVSRVLVLQEILKIDTAIWASVKKQAQAQVIRLLWHHAWEKKRMVRIRLDVTISARLHIEDTRAVLIFYMQL